MKVLASDFDNTIFFLEDELKTKNNVEAIRKFIINGNIFCLITGRTYMEIKEELNRLNLPYSYLICGDGALIFDNLDFCAELTMHANVCAVLPRILRDTELSALQRQMQEVYRHGVHEALVGNLGMLRPARACGFRIRGDFGLNLYNSASVNIAKKLGLESATLSFEMTLPQIRDASKAVPAEILAYGRLPLMVTENCLIKGKTGNCSGYAYECEEELFQNRKGENDIKEFIFGEELK